MHGDSIISISSRNSCEFCINNSGSGSINIFTLSFSAIGTTSVNESMKVLSSCSLFRELDIIGPPGSVETIFEPSFSGYLHTFNGVLDTQVYAAPNPLRSKKDDIRLQLHIV